jgi:hypothetical protein
LILAGIVAYFAFILLLIQFNRYAVSKKDDLQRALQAIVQPLLKSNSDNVNAFEGKLMRPYVIYNLGTDDDRAGRWTREGIDDGYGSLAVGDFRTIIIFQIHLIEERHYQIQGSIKQDNAYRWHCDAWAYDIKSGSLGGRLSVDDPPLLREYVNSVPRDFDYGALCKWADTITN